MSVRKRGAGTLVWNNRGATGRPRRSWRDPLESFELEPRCLLALTFNEFALPTANSFQSVNDESPSPVGGITPGPSGSHTIWFTESSSNKIGEINTTTHAITEFPVAPTSVTSGGIVTSSPATPKGITTGPDGNIWFTEVYGSRIGRLNPSTGTITEFDVPVTIVNGIGLYDTPWGIVAGPDGNLWYTGRGDTSITKIGRINPSTGVITEFGPTSSVPLSITTGPDGNLWFTEFSKIGMINPSTGTITEFDPPPAQGQQFGDIAVGPDGNLWFTQSTFESSAARTNTIGEINPTTHAFSIFTTPSPGAPTGITLGPDGNLWITEPAINKIAQVVTGAAITPIATMTTLTGGPNPSTVGQQVLFRALVNAVNSPGSPTASVTFYIDGQAQLPPVPLVMGNAGKEAVFRTTFQTAGQHSISATYSGDTRYASSQSNTVTQTVNAVAGSTSTTINISAAATTVAVNASNLITVHVLPAAEAGTPTGSVTFTLDGQQATPVTLVNGVAQVKTVALTAGQHTVSAFYTGDSTFAPNTTGISLTVVPTNTTTQLTSTPNPSTAGQPVAFTANVSLVSAGISANAAFNPPTLGSLPGAVLPPLTGSVSLMEGNTVIVTVPFNPNGGTVLTTASLPPGTHTITVKYSGNGNYSASTSNAVAQTVNGTEGDGPGVTSVSRFGFHAAPTTLLIGFNEPLDPTTAQNVNNYLIIGPGGGLIGVDAAVYNSATQSVTLHPHRRLDLHLRYILVVKGAGPGAITDTAGRPLDGAGTGQPGSNYVTTVDASNLVVIGNPPGAGAALQLKRRDLRLRGK